MYVCVFYQICFQLVEDQAACMIIDTELENLSSPVDLYPYLAVHLMTVRP